MNETGEIDFTDTTRDMLGAMLIAAVGDAAGDGDDDDDDIIMP